VRQVFKTGHAGRTLASLVACCMMLTACGTPLMQGEPLTPAQQQLKDSNARFNQTVFEGAAIGAVALGLVGAGLGAVVAGKQGAILGGAAGVAAGAALGGAIGYRAAQKNYDQAKNEDNLKQLIAAANDDAIASQRSAEASRQVAADARAKIAALNQQYKSAAITLEQYKRTTSTYQESSKYMAEQEKGMRQEALSLRTDAASQAPQDRRAMLESARELDNSAGKVHAANDNLVKYLASAPG
jgi:hypothetical protein